MTLEKLKTEALKGCERRGHLMGPFLDQDETKAKATCSICGKEVAVDTKPALNGIDMAGEAVALTCNGWSVIN